MADPGGGTSPPAITRSPGLCGESCGAGAALRRPPEQHSHAGLYCVCMHTCCVHACCPSERPHPPYLSAVLRFSHRSRPWTSRPHIPAGAPSPGLHCSLRPRAAGLSLPPPRQVQPSRSAGAQVSKIGEVAWLAFEFCHQRALQGCLIALSVYTGM